MKKLTKYQKAKIVVEIINSIKELPNKDKFYIEVGDEDGIMEKIAKKGGINFSCYGRESGMIDLSEYIQLTFDDVEDKWERKLNKTQPRQHNHSIQMFPEFKVSEELKLLTKKFEDENIPQSGPSKTLIGEMFRAIQRIQYRAFNDGDMWFVIGSESFMSYMYLVSMVDELNYSRHSYNEETGNHGFNFTDSFLKENSWDNKISDMIEHSLAKDAEFIKYQLIDLLSNNKIEDKPNEYNSRSFTRLKTERY